MSKPIRVASICHNETDRNDPKHRRVRLELRLELAKDDEGYVWRTASGEDCCIGACHTVDEAEIAALQAWGAYVWDFRAKWRTAQLNQLTIGVHHA